MADMAMTTSHVLNHFCFFFSSSKSILLTLPPTSLKGLQILVESSFKSFSRHIMGLSKFHDTLSPLILHFGGNISEWKPSQ
jgi:hypothetical protein